MDVLFCFSDHKGKPSISDKEILKELERHDIVIKEEGCFRGTTMVECSYVFTTIEEIAKRAEKDLGDLKPKRLEDGNIIKGDVITIRVKRNFKPVLIALAHAKRYTIFSHHG